jgi:ATP-dependent Clp endopeptidase proteolytic subunit ClpP
MTISPTKDQLEIAKLEAEARRHNALADVAELKAVEEKRLQDEHRASLWANRVYPFVYPVYDESVIECTDMLAMWSRLAPGCAITVVLNSPGGEVFEGLALYDFLDDLKAQGHELTIVVRGIAASMAGILLQAGSPGKRFVGKHAHVMLHELADIASGKHSEMKDAVKFNDKLLARLIGILAERSTMSERQIKTRIDRRDWWLDSAEAVKLGFADAVG